MYFVPKDWTERLTRGRRQRGSSYYEEEVHSSRVKRSNFFLKIKMLSGNKQDKVLLQENWRKVKVYGYKDLKWTLTHKGRKEIHRKYVERSQNGQETWRTGLSQGARTESGEVRTGMGGDVCSSHFLQPAHPSWSASRELAMEGGQATSEQTSRTLREQTARAIRGAIVLILITEISRSIKLIQGEINKGRVCQKILRIVTTIFMISQLITWFIQ